MSRLALGALVLFGLGALPGCWSGRYLTQQGLGQLRLLRSRRHIDEVLRDPTVPQETRRRLAVAQAARQFGVEVLGLHGGDGFTRFIDLGGKPIAWNVTAAPKDRLVPLLHRFPIVGKIPYLGFFHRGDAEREAARLGARDLDVSLRGVAGYSTLGIGADPIFSSMLMGSDARIVEVTLHEMTHATVYLPGHTDWNESLATVVGVAGAAQFFATRGDPATAATLLAEARRTEEDEQRFAGLLRPLVADLKRLYGDATLDRAAKLAARERLFTAAQARFLALFPPPPGRPPGSFAAVPLNNAVLLSYTAYHGATPRQRALLRALGGDLRAFVRLCKRAVEERADPLGSLARVLEKATAACAGGRRCD